MKKLLLIFLLFSNIVIAETEFKIIPLQHRFASDLLPIVTPMVGADGTVTGIDNQLILRASPEHMREIEETVSKLDAARVNRRITIQSNSNMQNQHEHIEATGAAKVGKVTVSNDRHTIPNSGRIEIENGSRDTSLNSNQFINVLDGERAFIRVGQTIPYTEEWVTITRRYVQIGRTTGWHEISTGFAVRPHTIGNQVELEITPRIARPNNQGFIDFEELTTVINTSLGSWVDIGGSMQNNDEVSRKILGIQRASNQQNSNLIVRVD